ncbi:MAG: RNA methyltransferase [Actinomycetota bacterium]|nr:RNA methyltransferase [Actinomycetota bacterium]MDD5665836.1 RNA methyltransferase [Actinomycetota bacterium]
MIESPKNERVRRYRRLRKRNFRYREGLFLAEGLQCVAEALKSSRALECIICSEKGRDALAAYADIILNRGVPCFTAAEEIVAGLSDTVTPQGIVAVCPLLHSGIEDIADGGAPTVVVANRVRDPGNLGNLIRIADAAGAGGLIVCAGSADLYNPKTVRSTAGSIFHVPLAVGGETSSVFETLKQAGYALYAADAHAGTGMWEAEWPDRLALVMGNEAWGMPGEETAMADGLVRIPILGEAESLNVSAAAAVLLYEVARRRNANTGEKEGG